MAYGNGDGKFRNLYEKSAKALNPQAVNNCYNKDMRIIGIDPGTGILGFGVIDFLVASLRWSLREL